MAKDITGVHWIEDLLRDCLTALEHSDPRPGNGIVDQEFIGDLMRQIERELGVKANVRIRFEQLRRELIAAGVDMDRR